MATVEVFGAQKLKARLVEMQRGLLNEAEKAIREIAVKIRDDAKRFCPVDTGSLKKSIRLGVTARPAGNIRIIQVRAGGYVTNPKTGRKVDYASHVEFGTSRQRPQPFMRPAIDNHKKDLARVLRRKISK